MSPTRRDTMKAAGAAGTFALLGGVAAASRDHENDSGADAHEDLPGEGEAAVSVGHFSPDAPAVDVRLVRTGGEDGTDTDGTDTDDEDGDGTLATGVGYGQVTEYTNVEAGNYAVQFLEAADGDSAGAPGDTSDGNATDNATEDTPDGNASTATPTENASTATPTENASTAAPTDNATNTTNGTSGGEDRSVDRTVVYETEITIEETFYTVAAVGELEADTFGAQVLEDYDVAQVRLVHVSPDAPAVDVTLEDSNLTLFEDVGFGETTDYVSIPGGEYSLEVREAAFNQSGEVVDTVSVDLVSGLAYSGFAAGYVEAAADEGGNEDSRAFELVTSVDGVTSGFTPGEADGEEDESDESDSEDEPTDSEGGESEPGETESDESDTETPADDEDEDVAGTSGDDGGAGTPGDDGTDENSTAD